MNKFFRTISVLISKAGRLSSEFRQGQRRTYIRPIVLFLVIGLLFFGIFYFFFRDQNISLHFAKPNRVVVKQTKSLLQDAYKKAKTKQDSAGIATALKAFDDSAGKKEDRDEDIDNENDETVVNLLFSEALDTSIKSVAAYDSAQMRLSAADRDDGLERKLRRVGYRLTELYGNDTGRFWNDLVNKFLHYFPYILIICLPVYILLLKLIYLRRRNFTLSSHAVFLLHLYAFTFLLFLFFLGVISLRQLTEEKRIWLTAFVIFAYLLIYLLTGMKRFYQQGWGKTLLKFILFNLLCSILLVGLFVVFFSISIF